MIKYICDICGNENAFTTVLNREEKELVQSNFTINRDLWMGYIEVCEECIKKIENLKDINKR